MKKIILFYLVICIISSGAKANEISAKSAVLIEPLTKRVIFDKDKDKKRPMASTTKIATAITAIENADLSEIVTISKKASLVEGSSIWLSEGEKLTVEDLLYGLMLSSGNDAAIAIAEHIEGYDKFIDLMNITAKKAGAYNTNFVNPNGLDDENHYTTAYDLALITAYAMKNPVFAEIVSTKTKQIPWQGHEWNRTLKNHNKLLSMYDGANGVKTGYTKKDGRCLVSSATRNDINLICVTLNAPNDWDDHKKLLDIGFSQLNPKEIVSKNDIKMVKVKNGVVDILSVKPKDDIIIPILSNDKVDIKYNLPDQITAPIKVGDKIGYAEIQINSESVCDVLFVAGESVDEYKPQTFLDNFIKLLNSVVYI